MPTSEYFTFESRLRGLATALPGASIAKSALNAGQIEKIAFFGVTAHATCEEFIERRCAAVVDEAVDRFNNRRFFGRVARHLCVMPFLSVNDRGDLERMAKVVGSPDFGIYVSKNLLCNNGKAVSDLIKMGHKKFQKVVSDNHGISTKYQFRLMSCIGLDISNFNPTFASRVIQLAGLRGEAAHNASVSARTIPEPSDLVQWTSDLLVGYLDLDTQLSRLVGKRR